LYDIAVNDGDSEEVVEEQEETNVEDIQKFMESNEERRGELEIDVRKYLKNPYKFDNKNLISLSRTLRENPEGVIGTLTAYWVKRFTEDIDPETGKENKIKAGFKKAVKKARENFSEVEKVFVEAELPKDFARLPLIESRWGEENHSPAGAVGFWQFMEETGRDYGLKIVREKITDESGKIIEGKIIYEERFNDKLSTIAAASHLKDLFEMTCNKELAMMWYNSGSKVAAKFMEKKCGNVSTLDYLIFKGKRLEEWYTHAPIKNRSTLSGIMRIREIPQTKANMERIMMVNGMTNPHMLRIGETLTIPLEFAEMYKSNPKKTNENLGYLAQALAIKYLEETGAISLYSDEKDSDEKGIYVVSHEPIEHIVGKNDKDMWSISKRYSRQNPREFIPEIRLISGLENNVIHEGQKLLIPQPKNVVRISSYVKNTVTEIMGSNPQVPDPYMDLPNGARIVYFKDSTMEVALR
ncbi:MAG: transglycosylase SLT domain-containing protein, partial [Nanoarchaeota archaeon]